MLHLPISLKRGRTIPKPIVILAVVAQFLFDGSITEVHELPLTRPGHQSRSVFNVIDFGAKGDGVALDTKAIQEAIDRCTLNGGKVLFPDGKFLTGSVVLRSNVEIYLSRGTVILGSTRLSDYQPHSPRTKSFNDSFLKYSLFYAEGVSNVSFEGNGTIDGQGSAFKVTTKKKPERYMNRPFVLRFVESRNVRVEGITLRNSAMWMQHYFGCQDVTIKGIKVFNHANQNNDMIDIDGCSNVQILECYGDTDDDGITLKSTSPLIDSNIKVSNCIVSSHNNAVKLGTESTGGFRNVTISGIVIRPSAVKSVMFGKPDGVCGIALEVVDGGRMEGINVSNITMDSVEVPLFIRLGNRGRKYAQDVPAPAVGSISGISIDNVTATHVGSTGCSITGIPGHNVKDITLKNIRILATGAGTLKDTNNVIPELVDSYPESTMWGKLPAYGFFIRHADAVSLLHISLHCTGSEKRPAIVCDDVENSDLSDVTAACDPAANSLFEFRDVRNMLVRNSRSLSNISRFLSIEGSNNAVIRLTGNDFTNVGTPFGGSGSNAVVSEGNTK